MTCTWRICLQSLHSLMPRTQGPPSPIVRLSNGTPGFQANKDTIKHDTTGASRSSPRDQGQRLVSSPYTALCQELYFVTCPSRFQAPLLTPASSELLPLPCHLTLFTQIPGRILIQTSVPWPLAPAPFPLTGKTLLQTAMLPVSPAQLCAQSSCVQAARGCCRKYRLIGRNPRLSGLGWPCSDPTTLSGVGLTVRAPGACCRGPGGTAPHALPRAHHPLPTFTVDLSPSPLTCPAALSPQPGVLRCGSAPGSHPCHAEAPKPRSQGVSCLSLCLPPQLSLSCFSFRSFLSGEPRPVFSSPPARALTSEGGKL